MVYSWNQVRDHIGHSVDGFGGKFQLHELIEIVGQSSDPDFAQLLNRVWEGQQTDKDVIQIKALANT